VGYDGQHGALCCRFGKGGIWRAMKGCHDGGGSANYILSNFATVHSLYPFVSVVCV
jgi:hypothetical protein